MQSNKRADERRRAGMQPSPTPDEAKEEYAERLETMNNPEPPTPTQAEADALKAAAEQPGAAREDETPEAKQAREEREARETPEERAAREAREKQQRDMRPNPNARYTTR